MCLDPVIVVDGYSTGNFLLKTLSEFGVTSVHVRSTDEFMRTMVLPELTGYRHCLTWTGKPAGSEIEALKALKPVAVIAGSELGVTPADQLAELLECPGNGAARAERRRDKFTMIESLRSAGLHTASQHVAEDPEEAVSWSESSGYPVVVKPLRAASSQNVRVCKDADEVRSAGAEVLAATTMFGEANSRLLVQSFLCGTEYVVDSVSLDGGRYTCGIWRYEKSLVGGHPLYDRDILVDPASPESDSLIAYVDAALEALGIEQGPSHAEVIMTADGPALVEVGARLNGNMNQDFHRECLGKDQASMTVLAAVSPETFQREYVGRRYNMLQGAAVYNAVSTRSGTVARVDEEVLTSLEALPTVWQLQARVSAGERIEETCSLLTSPLRAFMLGGEQALDRDHEQLKTHCEQVFQVDVA